MDVRYHGPLPFDGKDIDVYLVQRPKGDFVEVYVLDDEPIACFIDDAEVKDETARKLVQYFIKDVKLGFQEEPSTFRSFGKVLLNLVPAVAEARITNQTKMLYEDASWLLQFDPETQMFGLFHFHTTTWSHVKVIEGEKPDPNEIVFHERDSGPTGDDDFIEVRHRYMLRELLKRM